MHTKQDYIEHVIPYRLKAVDTLNVACRNRGWWGQKMKICFDNKLAIRGTSSAWMNPVIEAGVMHCRALLEFMGLALDRKNQTKLVERHGRQADDFAIEQFSGPSGKLEKVTVDQALDMYRGPKLDAEIALASVIHTANKGIAHMTSGMVIDLTDVDRFEIASRGVPALIIQYFYNELTLSTPDYKNKYS